MRGRRCRREGVKTPPLGSGVGAGDCRAGGLWPTRFFVPFDRTGCLEAATMAVQQ